MNPIQDRDGQAFGRNADSSTGLSPTPGTFIWSTHYLMLINVVLIYIWNRGLIKIFCNYLFYTLTSKNVQL